MSEQLLRNALFRLSQQKVVASVYRGFYTVIPVQYQLRGAVPPMYYIDQLMSYLHKPYYISLLSAAEMHGAAHQRPQRMSVTTLRPSVRTARNELIVWTYRQSLPESLLCRRNSETGTVCYSSAELTAVELVQFERLVGGLSMAATVLSELVERTNFSGQVEELMKSSSMAVIQRLGYILDEVLEERQQAECIYLQLKELKVRMRFVRLSAEKPSSETMPRDKRWKVIVNQDIELDEI